MSAPESAVSAVDSILDDAARYARWMHTVSDVVVALVALYARVGSPNFETAACGRSFAVPGCAPCNQKS